MENELQIDWSSTVHNRMYHLLIEATRPSQNNTPAQLPDHYQRFYHAKRILVTGGAGGIGSHLVDRLVVLGAQVTVLDNLSTGKRENLAQYRESIRLMIADITDKQAVTAAARDAEVIFHLAGFTSVPNSITDPGSCYETNVVGMLAILNTMRPETRLICASSAAVYGNHREPSSEYSPCAPTSPYGTSKHIAEQLCTSYATHAKKTIVSLRYFNVFGPRLVPSGIIPHLMHKIAGYEPIVIQGDGTQTRDFVSVESVVTANLAAGATGLPHGHHIYNVASGKSMQINALVELLRKACPDYRGPISHTVSRPGDLYYSAANCSNLHNLLSYME